MCIGVLLWVDVMHANRFHPQKPPGKLSLWENKTLTALNKYCMTIDYGQRRVSVCRGALEQIKFTII